jgi:Cu/Ag efflux pump CusA
MAYAIIGGLFVATLLTLLFLPALYIACFGIKKRARSDRYRSKNRRLLRRAA